MEFVWFTSYLCIFMLGGAITLLVAVKLLNRAIDKYEEELKASAAQKTLQELFEPYTMHTKSSQN